MEFDNTKKGILDFYETTENAIKEHNKTFSKLIHKLNEPSSITKRDTEFEKYKYRMCQYKIKLSYFRR
jgi:hypothetical protein